MSDESAHSTDDIEYDHFTPCPGCDSIGHTVQVWIGEMQMMECGDNDCRVHEYEPRPIDSATEQ